MKKIVIREEDIPQKKKPPTPLAGDKKAMDVVLAIDSSGSMEATDMTPTRFEAAKKAALHFTHRKIVKGYDDRVGVLTFGGNAYIVCTLDSDLEKTVTQAISGINGITHTSTGIGAALQAAAGMLGQGQGLAATAKGVFDNITGKKPADRGRVIVLLTDGVSYVGPDPRKVAQGFQGIRVFTIGIGTPKGQYMETPLFKDTVRLDEALLKDIAKMTGGKYFHAPGAQELVGIFEELADE